MDISAAIAYLKRKLSDVERVIEALEAAAEEKRKASISPRRRVSRTDERLVRSQECHPESERVL